MHAGCVAGIASLVPSILDRAKASIHGSSSPSVFNGGKSQINLSDLQIGGDYPFLNCLKTAQIWSFISGGVSAPVTPDLLDANGYPTTIINGGVDTVFYVPPQSERPGNYVITWDGTGTVFCGMTNTLVSGSKTSSGGVGAGRYVFSTTSNRFVIGISAIGSSSNYISNMKVFHANDETALNAGQVFGVKFKQRLIEAGFGVIRFLGWQAGNICQVSTWNSRRPASFVWYSGSETRPSIYAGVTTNIANAYSVGVPPIHTSTGATWNNGDAPAQGDTIIVNLNASATQAGTCSLQVGTGGSSSAINVLTQITLALTAVSNSWPLGPGSISTLTSLVGGTGYTNGTYTGVPLTGGSGTTALATIVVSGGLVTSVSINSTGTNAGINYLANDVLSASAASIGGTGSGFTITVQAIGGFRSMACLVYDATLNAWIKRGGDVNEGSQGLNNGAPYELMVQLCKEVGAHPYFIGPQFAVDPMTDFYPQLATYCNSYAASNATWMVPRFEGPNELWNTAPGFNQTVYAQSKANVYHAADPTHWPNTNDYQNWYGKVLSTIGQAVNAVYGGTPTTPTKYQVLCGVQTSAATSFPSGTNSSNPRLSSAAYVAQTAPPQSGYTQTAASGWVTHIDCAQYTQPSDYNTGTETTLAAAFAGKAFIASITSDVMTVTALNASNSATFAVGDTIFGTEIFAAGGGVPANTTILSFGTGTGGTGTYNLSSSGLTVASQNMTGGADLTAPNTYGDTVNSGSGSFNLTNLLTLYTNWKAWAQSFSINKMCGYEGGYSPDFTAGGNSQVDMLRAVSKLDPNLSTFTTTNYTNFTGLSGGGFTAEFPSCLTFTGNPNILGYPTNVWSISDDIYQSPNSPQWTAIVAFN